MQLGSWVRAPFSDSSTPEKLYTCNHIYLADKKELDNFAQWGHRETIKNEGKIYSACGDGKIPLISAKDIAAVAFHALTDTEPPSTDYRVLGGELLTYDDVWPPIQRLSL